MSRLGKLRAREQRRQAKRARKESRKRYWESLMAAGKNSKVKEDIIPKMFGFDHPYGPCGNIGCKKCNPEWYNQTTPRLLQWLHVKLK
jgi:hypothetical protein